MGRRLFPWSEALSWWGQDRNQAEPSSPSQGSGSPCWTLESRLPNALGGAQVGAKIMPCGCALKALVHCPEGPLAAHGGPRGYERVHSV